MRPDLLSWLSRIYYTGSISTTLETMPSERSHKSLQGNRKRVAELQPHTQINHPVELKFEA